VIESVLPGRCHSEHMRHAVVVALLLVCALSGAAVAQESPDVSSATTTFTVDLQANGDADWTVRTTVRIDTEEERSAFRSYGEQFVDGDAAVGPDIAFFESASDAASAAADREMQITNVERDYATSSDAGTLVLGFRWTNFLAESGDGYELSDALLTGDGTWLRSLEPGQEIRIHTPPGYEIQRSIEARQENDSLVVTGPESFDPEQFSVVYRPAGGTGETQPGSSISPDGTPSEGIDVVTGALLGLLFLVVAVLAVWRWRGGEPIAAVGNGDEPPDSAGAADGGAEATAAADENGIDHDLLSDEERVEALLEQNGGRMRQADIVAETDWSDAKVSQLLSRMADEGSVEKLRLGRENVISLPDGEDGQA